MTEKSENDELKKFLLKIYFPHISVSNNSKTHLRLYKSENRIFKFLKIPKYFHVKYRLIASNGKESYSRRIPYNEKNTILRLLEIINQK
jgi:hypothetical protein